MTLDDGDLGRVVECMSKVTDGECSIVADDVRVLELFTYDVEFINDVSDTAQSFLAGLAP